MDRLLADPVLLAAGVAAAVVLLTLGWMLRGLLAARADKAHQSALLDARRAIPQLESAVRGREQKLERLNRETGDLTDQCVDLKTRLTASDAKSLDLDREVQRLKSELATLKGGEPVGNQPMIDGVGLSLAAGDTRAASGRESGDLDQVPAELYERLKEGLFERDAKIAVLERKLAEPEEPVAAGPDATELRSENAALTEALAASRATAERLQQEVQELHERNEMVAELAKQRSNRNRALTDPGFAERTLVPELEAQVEEHIHTIADLETAVKRLTSQHDEAVEAHTLQRERVASLEQDLVAAQAESDDECEQIVALHDRLRAADARNEVQKQEVIVLCQSLETFKTAIAERDRAITMLDHQLKAEQRPTGTPIDAELQAEREVRIEAMADEISGLRMRAGELEESIAAMRGNEAELLRRNVTLEETVARLRDGEAPVRDQAPPPGDLEVADLRADLANRERWLTRLRQSLHDRDARIRELESALDAVSG